MRKLYALSLALLLGGCQAAPRPSPVVPQIIPDATVASASLPDIVEPGDPANAAVVRLVVQLPQMPSDGLRTQQIRFQNCRSMRVEVIGWSSGVNDLVNITPSSQPIVRTLTLQAAANRVVKVTIYDQVNGGGRTLGQIAAMVDLTPGVANTVTVNRQTTPLALLFERLYNRSTLRTLYTDESAIGTFVTNFVQNGTPDDTSDDIHPFRIDIDALLVGLHHYWWNYTPGLEQVGYNLPPFNHPMLSGAVTAKSTIPIFNVLNPRGRAENNFGSVQITDPITSIVNAAGTPFPMGEVGVGTWDAYYWSGNNAGGTQQGFRSLTIAAGRTFVPPDGESCILRDPTIQLVAGSGTAGSGNGTSGATAQFNNPRQMILDEANSALYVADTGNHMIRMINTTTNMVTTIVNQAGGSGSTGDGNAATGAKLSSPKGIARDNNGNLYIADTGNHKIRKVDTGGNISTFAGTGTAGADGDGNAAVDAQLSSPTSLAISSANELYVLDSGNGKIRKINLTSGTITNVTNITIATGITLNTNAETLTIGKEQLSAFESEYLYYVIGDPPLIVRKLLSTDNPDYTVGTVSTAAGGGAKVHPNDLYVRGIEAQLINVRALAADQIGNLYFSDQFTSGDAITGRVRWINPSKTGVLITIAGKSTSGNYGGDAGKSVEATMSVPYGLATDGTNDQGPIYLGTGLAGGTNNQRIRKVVP